MLTQNFWRHMTNKLEEVALQHWEAGYALDPVARYWADRGFQAGVKYLSTKLRTLAFPNGTEDQVIRLSDLEKIVGEE